MTGFFKTFPRLRRHLKIAGWILLVLLAIDGAIIASKWPFKREENVFRLKHISGSEVYIGAFRHVFFPSPGYTIENLRFVRQEAAGPVTVASVRTLTCRASWFALFSFTHRVKQMRIIGLNVFIPAHVPAPVPLHAAKKEKTLVTQVIADGAVLEVAPRNGGGEPLRLDFHQFVIGNVAAEKSMSLHALVHVSRPGSEVRIDGNFGPIDPHSASGTPLSGVFDLLHADLSEYRVIAGMVSATGRFQGELRRLDVQGKTDIANFEVTSSRHELGVSGEFHVIVDGRHGDVSIGMAQVHFLNTTIAAHGSIASAPGTQGKTVALHLEGEHARIEDLMRLFVKADRPPLSGPIQFGTSVKLPPGHEPFLRKVQMKGEFSITNARFSHTITQEKVDKLSSRARKHDRNAQEVVLSSLKGDAAVRNGTAFLSNLSFRVPGAVVRAGGDYGLITEAVDVRGTLTMQASLSEAAGGIKSLLLLPLDPLFKKHHAGAVIPVSMTGSYSHPVFKVSLTGKGSRVH